MVLMVLLVQQDHKELLVILVQLDRLVHKEQQVQQVLLVHRV
jgi:hypothetical protein